MEIQITGAGAQTLSLYVPTGASPSFLSITDWEQLPSGQLKSLLTAQYVTDTDPVDRDFSAFASACADVGLTISGACVGGGVVAGYFTLSNGVTAGYGPIGSPVFLKGAGASFGDSVRIETAYSASE